MKRIIFLFVLGLYANFAYAADIVKVLDPGKAYSLTGNKIDILVDLNGNLTIDSITSSLYQNGFKANETLDPRNKNRKAVYWVRFTLQAGLKNVKLILLLASQNADRVDFFQPSSGMGYKKSSSGDFFPFNSRKYKHRDFSFEIDPQSNIPLTYYLRFESKDPITLASFIKPNPVFINEAIYEYYFLGLLYGMVLAIMLYNLIVYIITREMQYLWYVLYLLFLIVNFMSTDGTAFQFLWPNYPQFKGWGFSLTDLGIVVVMLLFTREFLTSHGFRNLRRLINWLILSRIIMFLILEIYQVYLQNSFDFLYYIAIFIIAIHAYNRGYPPARYFILSFVFIILGYGLLRAKALDLIPLGDWAYDVFKYGFILGSIMISAALADRMKELKLAKERADRRIIEQLRENEVQLLENEALRDKVNRELEAKVALRTEEIHAQQMQIEQMNTLLQEHNLKLQEDVQEISKARVTHKSITLEEFKAIYPDELSCLKYLADIKEQQGFKCIKCGSTAFGKGKVPYSRRCKECRYLESATVGTIFEHLRFSLDKALYMVFLIRTGKEISIEALSAQLELRKQTCWVFKKKILDNIKNRKSSKRLVEEWEYLFPLK